MSLASIAHSARHFWGFTENAPEAVRFFFRWRFWRELGRIELIERLDAHESDAGTGIFINLETETALRSYIVFDHGPWGGAVVMDGGFWITFDLPSFVDEFAEALNACPWHARMLGRCRSPHV